MLNNKVNFNLVNIFLIVLVFYLLYQTKSFWIVILETMINIFMPFLIAFFISYALYPIVRKMVSYNIPKVLAVFILLIIILGMFILIINLIIPTIFIQLGDIIANIIAFFNKIGSNYSFSYFEKNFNIIFNEMFQNFSKNISYSAISAISISLKFITKIFIILVTTIYFLIDMDKIRFSFFKIIRMKSRKLEIYIRLLDEEITKYLSCFFKISIISFFEYLLIYLIIGHPNYFMLALLAGVGNFVPYLGGILANVVAIITSIAVCDKLFIKTCIVLIVFSIIDSYLINPFLFGKSNKLHPLLVIVSIFVGGLLFGFLGIVIALPVTIIVVTTYNYYKMDINNLRKRYNFCKKM